MRFLTYSVLALGLAVIASAFIYQDPGYMLISFKTWTVEMPLWLGIIFALLSTLIVYGFLSALRGLMSVRRNISDTLKSHRSQVAYRLTTKGLIELAEGHWQRAERLLLKAARHSKTPLINYLSAAHAAQEQGKDDRRDDHLRAAHAVTEGTDIAVGLTQAQLQLKQGQYEQCLATLTRLRALAPNHGYILKLLQQVYFELKDWEKLTEILPDVRDADVLSESEMRRVESKAYVAYLEKLSDSLSLPKLKQFWFYQVPRHVRDDLDTLLMFVEALINQKALEDAEVILKDAIKAHWEPRLVACYGHVQGAQPAKQLAQAEQWLKAHPRDPILLLAAGRLASRLELWGKAKHYFEESLKAQSSAEVLSELGQLAEQMGELELAKTYFRKGCLLAA